ncbi:MAG: M56 family metallopeptidase [Bacteroidales bacterium]|nr:M56 family metallopeptidase [Bacteroidales bacterium]
MIRWIVFSTLSAGLLYGLYCLTLRRDRWLQLSLWYLLVALGFSLVFPFISLPDRLSAASQAVIPTGEYLMTLDEVVISDITAPYTLGWIVDIYLVGFALCAAYLLFQMAAQAVVVIRLRRRHSVYRAIDGFDIPRGAALILLDDDTAPYSFFNQIVVGTRGLTDDELRCILAHESLHVRQFHSLDILFARLMCCLAWFNPFAWLIMRELRAVQEFQADAASLGACGREDYLRLLYRQATGFGYGHITNNFNSINIKNRIVMMNKSKTRFGAWKLAAALPVVALLLVVGCKPAATETAEPAEQAAVAEPSVEPVLFDYSEDSLPEGFKSPEYEGGMEALYKYLAENIKYPEQAKADGIQGRVLIRFVVMNDGSIVNVEVARGIGGGCDEEAVRVVKGMSKWKPAVYEGKAVNVQYALPITFKLQ